jgi:general secretion pathway protein I
MNKKGFSLLEVMIALAIFGLMIVGVLAAQAGVAATNRKAANVGQAIELARCKMSETEEKLLINGYPEIDDINTDVLCCEGTEKSTFACDTRVEKVVMPEPPSTSAFGADGGAGLNPLGTSSAGPNGAPSDQPFNATLDLDAGLGGIAQQLGPQAGGQGAAGMLNMVMGFVYPTMKPLLEASIRRVTITVHWKEGPNLQEFTIIQYVTSPQRGGFGLGFGEGGAPPPISTTTTGGTSAPAGNGVSPATGNPGGFFNPVGGGAR